MKIYLSSPLCSGATAADATDASRLVQCIAYDAAALLKVVLSQTVPELFAPGTLLYPCADGVGVLWPDEDPQAAQLLGRTLAQNGMFKVDLTHTKLNDSAAVVSVLMGMYDGMHDITAAVNLDAAALKTVQHTLEILAQARAIAGSSAHEAAPLQLLPKLIALCDFACKQRGSGSLKTTIIKRGDVGFERFTGLNAVGAGSAQDPAMGIIEYIPSGEEESADTAALDVALVGKGICFDSGGYDLKSSKFMSTMRTDKCGAVYVAAALALAILQGLKRRCACYLPCAENLVSGTAMLPGDILTYPDGTTIEINNTDAEGRLILADGLLAAAARSPRLLIDAATLTGAAKVAVGRDYTAYLTPDHQLAAQVETCFNAAGENVWRLPLNPLFARFMASRRADMTNSAHGDGAPGASTAAIFLQNFVPSAQAWVHFDLSSAFMPDGSPYFAPQQATAAGVRALAKLLLADEPA